MYIPHCGAVHTLTDLVILVLHTYRPISYSSRCGGDLCMSGGLMWVICRETQMQSQSHCGSGLARLRMIMAVTWMCCFWINGLNIVRTALTCQQNLWGATQCSIQQSTGALTRLDIDYHAGCLVKPLLSCKALARRKQETWLYSGIFITPSLILMRVRDTHKNHHHHHHWLDSPWWALAFLRSCAQSSVLRTTFFQFWTSNILISWLTKTFMWYTRSVVIVQIAHRIDW